MGFHSYLRNYFEYISLSVFDSQISNNQNEREIDEKTFLSSFFYKYCKRKNRVKIEDVYSLKLNFIKDYNIQLIITGGNVVLAKNLRSLVIDSVIDFTANEKYFLLSKQLQ